MTISASAVYPHLGHEDYRITIAGIWRSANQQSDAGRVAITVLNHSARFPERLVERLLVHSNSFGNAIGGAINETGTPVVRRVRLYRRSDGQLVGETLSNAGGDYRIGNMPADVLHYAIALDDLGADPNFNALILDQLVGGEVALLPEPFAIGLYMPAMPIDYGGVSGHRYWRIKSIVAGGGFFEISELALFDNGVDVTSGASKSSSDTPTNSLSLLFDGSLSTRCYWTEATAEASGFYIAFDFGLGVAVNINGVKQAGFDTNGRHMSGFTLEYSDDGSAWTALGSKSSLTYPGNNTWSALYSFP